MEEEKKLKKTVKKTTKAQKPSDEKEVVKKVTPKKVIDEKVFAIVEINKQQEKVHTGEMISVDLLDGTSFKFDKVLMYTDGKTSKFGTPYLEGFQVNAKKVNDYREKKIKVETFKAKSRYRKAKGHRQPKTKILINEIIVK